MVEIISLPDSLVILTNRCNKIRTAVTPNRASDIILELYCAI